MPALLVAYSISVTQTRIQTCARVPCTVLQQPIQSMQGVQHRLSVKHRACSGQRAHNNNTPLRDN